MNPVNRSRIAELYKLVDELTTDIIALKVQAAQDAADKKTVIFTITETIPSTVEGAEPTTKKTEVTKGDLEENKYTSQTDITIDMLTYDNTKYEITISEDKKVITVTEKAQETA